MKKLLLLMIVVAAVQLQSSAAISVENSTSPAVLKSNGYSAQLADTAQMSKARSLGKHYYTQDEKDYMHQNKFVRFWRKLYVYADPAAEDYSFYHHNTDSTPDYTDL